VLAFAFQLIGSSFGALGVQLQGVRDIAAPKYASNSGYGGGAMPTDSAYSYGEKIVSAIMPQVSTRNAAPSLPPSADTTGNTAEQFEITAYNASIETQHLDETCGDIQALKAREDVIFENANIKTHDCSFTFKVEHKSAEEILGIIKKLDPKELSENIYTIKSQVDDYTSESEILQKKRASIDETLSSAVNAYDEITRLATATQNADALAKIIDSKIGIIERLTQERIDINDQLDRLSRAKAEQLDGLDYTRFNVNVYENKFVDGQQLKDSWKAAIKDFVGNLNGIVQGITLNLVLLLLLIVQWLLYAVILLFVVKYGWRFGKYLWFR
jgi:hypothetical protein